jgi:2-polyprenyl-3-methyl-5-hydroxy-6-metoxy-1,4-benzoquinol methylase
VSTEHKFELFWEHNGLKVVDCVTCGYKHLYPLPKETDTVQLYSKEFGGKVRKNFIDKKNEDAEYWSLAFERRSYVYEKYIHKNRFNLPRMLDIGCGTGNFLNYFKNLGYDIQGIEPSENFTSVLEENDIPCLPKLFEEITPDEWKKFGCFDIINMSMFLEHVIDPFSIIKKAFDLLTPGGILTIESPNDFNPLQLSIIDLQKLPMWWITPLHINYFDFESLEFIVTKAGFTPITRNSQFPLELFLHFGEKYIGSKNVGRAVHIKRVAFEKGLHFSGHGRLLNDLYNRIAEVGLGRTAIIHCMKESQ